MFKGDQTLVLLLGKHFIWGWCPRKVIKLAMCTLNVGINGGGEKELVQTHTQKKLSLSGNLLFIQLDLKLEVRVWLRRIVVPFA